MKLSHLKKSISKNTGRPVIQGATAYAIPAGTPVVLKKCDQHNDCYVLWAMEPRKSKVQGVFF